jgi:hypothetical protein
MAYIRRGRRMRAGRKLSITSPRMLRCNCCARSFGLARCGAETARTQNLDIFTCAFKDCSWWTDMDM